MTDATAAVPVPDVELNEDLTIQFETITIPAGSYSSITIREPSAAQIGQWSALDGTAAQIKAVSVCGAVPVSVVEQMKARPFMQAVRRVEGFLN